VAIPALGAAPPSSAISRVPQFPQKRAPATIGSPHTGQPIRVPQLTQNFASARFSVWQARQITAARLYRSHNGAATTERAPGRGLTSFMDARTLADSVDLRGTIWRNGMARGSGAHVSRLGVLIGTLAIALSAGPALASSPGTDVRLTNDSPSRAGYVSADDIAGLPHYTDDTLDECSRSRGRQNEPAVAINPRDSRVMIGSSNDYCAVYNHGEDEDGAPIPTGPIWLGYYRSQNGGQSFVSSLVPGYPGDTSQLGRRAHIRTASSGDPVIAWDAQGRVFMGSESSDDPAGTKKTFGDVWVARYVNPAGRGGNTLNDGKKFAGSVIVERGSSAPNLLGKFNDKTAIEADRTNSSCRGNVYFAWSRFTGNGGVAIYLARSTDHGRTFSTPTKLSEGIHDVQGPTSPSPRTGTCT
jgi:hypothetical protein